MAHLDSWTACAQSLRARFPCEDVGSRHIRANLDGMPVTIWLGRSPASAEHDVVHIACPLLPGSQTDADAGPAEQARAGEANGRHSSAEAAAHPGASTTAGDGVHDPAGASEGIAGHAAADETRQSRAEGAAGGRNRADDSSSAASNPSPAGSSEGSTHREPGSSEGEPTSPGDNSASPDAAVLATTVEDFPLGALRILGEHVHLHTSLRLRQLTEHMLDQAVRLVSAQTRALVRETSSGGDAAARHIPQQARSGADATTSPGAATQATSPSVANASQSGATTSQPGATTQEDQATATQGG